MIKLEMFSGLSPVITMGLSKCRLRKIQRLYCS